MNYIINPSWFYWLSVADKISGALLFLIIVCSVWCLIAAILVIIQGAALCDFPNDEEEKEKFNNWKNGLVIGVISVVLLLLVRTFIPGKETLIEMQVAKYATYENAEWTVEAVKGAVDYIVQAIQSANGG